MLTGLDTNVLVRYFTRDDEAQWLRAQAVLTSFTQEEPAFISLVTLAELFWVLCTPYKLSKQEVVMLFERLLRTPSLAIENADIVGQALRSFAETSADFADALIEQSGVRAGCVHTLTFDAKAARSSGIRLVP